jgi:hypothetical protein
MVGMHSELVEMWVELTGFLAGLNLKHTMIAALVCILVCTSGGFH